MHDLSLSEALKGPESDDHPRTSSFSSSPLFLDTTPSSGMAFGDLSNASLTQQRSPSGNKQVTASNQPSR